MSDVIEQLKKEYTEVIKRINKAHQYFMDNPNCIDVKIEIINNDIITIPGDFKCAKLLKTYQELLKDSNRIIRELKFLGYEISVIELENGFKE